MGTQLEEEKGGGGLPGGETFPPTLYKLRE